LQFCTISSRRELAQRLEPRALAGLLGVVDRPVSACDRVTVMLQVLSGPTRVEMPREALAIA
jgi:hypothetical protein